jgi:class 3 adenylate cyclase
MSLLSASAEAWCGRPVNLAAMVMVVGQCIAPFAPFQVLIPMQTFKLLTRGSNFGWNCLPGRDGGQPQPQLCEAWNSKL